MEKTIKEFIKAVEKKNRKRFFLEDLEDYVSSSYGSGSGYLDHGGYFELAKIMINLEEDRTIRSIKASDYNGLNPPLKLKWEIVGTREGDKWNRSRMMQMSDYLDFTYYLRNPGYQEGKEWEYIENVYGFLKTRHSRQWASIEERSLELFYDEKYLTNKEEDQKGKYGILKRLGISHEDLKMKKYGEMFIYWNRGTKDIKRALILENHSTFFSYKRVAEEGASIFGFHPDILIYGGGNKIENSLSFVEEIANPQDIKILYFGDLDSEGLGIYYRLRKRYEEMDISLQKEAYLDLIRRCKRDYKRKSKSRNQLYLDYFIGEMGKDLNKDLINKLNLIWRENLRIPQELIDYEYLMR